MTRFVCMLMVPALMLDAPAALIAHSEVPRNQRTSQLLDEYQNSLKSLKLVAMTLKRERFQVKTWSEAIPNGKSVSVARITIDGPRARVDTFDMEAFRKVSESVGTSMVKDGIWYTYSAHEKGVLVVDRDGDGRRGMMLRDYVDPWFGYVQGIGGKTIAQELEEASVIDLAPGTELVEGRTCQRLSAQTPSGHFMLWLDNDAQHGLVKLDIQVGKDDSYNGIRLGELGGEETASNPFVSSHLRYEGSDFQQVGSCSVPMSGKVTVENVMRDGRTFRFVEFYARSDIQFGPTPDAESVFSLAIPEGTPIDDWSSRDSTATNYIWHDGRVRRAYEGRQIQAIDAEFGKAKASIPTQPSEDAAVASQFQSDAYCGLFCVYAAQRQLGIDRNFGELVREKFLGSPEGSSLAELREAAESAGLHALAASNLTVSWLHRCSLPAVLHVKSEGANHYDHWVLYFGDERGLARVFDPATGSRRSSFGALASRWDRTALLLSNVSIDTSAIRRFDTSTIVVFVFLIGGGILILHFLKSRSFAWRRAGPKSAMKSALIAVPQGLAILAAATACGLAYHTFADVALFKQRDIVLAVTRSHLGDFLPKLSASDVRRAIGKALIIDARYPDDFASGHLPGAINIPPGQKLDGFEPLRSLPLDRQLIVYCQSESCPFAKILAQRISDRGYSNIALFSGGYAAWVDNQGVRVR